MTLDSAVHYMPLVIASTFAYLWWIMRQRKLGSEFPIFFRYVAFYALELLAIFVLLILCNTVPPVYQFAIWTASFANTIVTFFVLYEVLIRILKPFAGVIDLAKLLFRWAGCFLLLVAILAAVSGSGSQQDKVLIAMRMLDRSLLLMECGLLMLLMTFEKRMRITWRSHSMGITLGLGIAAAVDLIASQLLAQFPVYETQINLIQGFTMVGCIAYWAVLLRQPEPQRKTVLDSPSRLIFQRWNEVLMGSPLSSSAGGQIAMAEVDSFIPGVEKTVERIMARKMTIN